MAWLLQSAGSAWPASLESVANAYWALLDDPPIEPDLVVVRTRGWAESRGSFQGARRWYAIYPLDGGPVALALTVQLPASWEEHARTFLDGVTLLP